MKTLKEIKPDNKKKDNELFWSKLLNLSMAEAIRKKTYSQRKKDEDLMGKSSGNPKVKRGSSEPSKRLGAGNHADNSK